MTSAPPRHVAIVGSGPSGLYAADALVRAAPDIGIDIYERLPTPFGLVRSGVAPDHPGTKAVVRQFEKLFERPNVHFIGNVEVGRDVSLEALQRAYDLLFIAAGAPVDRRLAIPGEDMDGVYGSAAITGWYNGHPDWIGLAPRIGERVVIVGMGNVALDIARLLARRPEELAAIDLPSCARTLLRSRNPRQVWLMARRGPLQASFTPTEMAALSAMTSVSISSDDVDILETGGDPAIDRRLAVLRGCGRNDAAAQIHLCFDRTPTEILGNDRVEAIAWRDGASGRIHRQPCDTVITAIGYQAQVMNGLSLVGGRADCDAKGRIGPRTYALGWLRRGPSGTIATNRQEAKACVADALGEVAMSDRRPGERDALLRALRAGGPPIVDWHGWKRIEAAEKRAPTGARVAAGWARLIETAQAGAI